MAELLELVEQLPELPLTLEEDVATWAVEELPLQLYAFATFGNEFITYWYIRPDLDVKQSTLSDFLD